MTAPCFLISLADLGWGVFLYTDPEPSARKYAGVLYLPDAGDAQQSNSAQNGSQDGKSDTETK